MALTFNPPDWLIRDYYDRRQQAGQIGPQLLQLADVIGSQQLQSERNKLLQQQQVFQKAGLTKDYASAVAELGPEQASQIYSPTFKSLGMQSPIIQALPEQSDQNLMEEFKTDPLAFQNRYGTKRADKLRQALTTQQSLALNEPVSAEEFAALKGSDPEEIARVFPQGVPARFVSSALMSGSRQFQIRTDPITGEPIRVPVTGDPGVIETPGRKLSPLQSKLDPIEYKDWIKTTNDFSKDSVVKANRDMINQMAKVEGMVANYNPALTGPIKSRQARAIAGEVGVLTDSDIARQALDPSVRGRLKSLVSVAVKGELPENQLDFLRQSLSAIKSVARSNLSQTTYELAERKANLYGGKVSTEELVESLGIPTNITGFSANQASGNNEDPLGIR